MNCAVYIFGKFSSGYTQYPHDDSSAAIFSQVCRNAKAITQIAVHRDGKLMYYCYIRKLQHNQCIGLCVVLNDALITNFGNLFALFENTISTLSEHGYLIGYDDYGNIVGNTSRLYNNPEEIDIVVTTLKHGIDKLSTNASKLPAENYSVNKNAVKSFSIEADSGAIVRSAYTNGYTYIYKSKDFQTTQMRSYQSVLHKVSHERDYYAKQLSESKSEVLKLKAKQRNLTWVGILGMLVIVFGGILWNKVLFPSEVTHYNTGDFDYYGPMVNKKPEGVGVAIYHDKDSDGRKYYIGNFVKGERQDNFAILFYKDGNYFYGKMEGDKWNDGLFYKSSDGTYFIGTFDSINRPYNGTWYDHVMKYKTVNGEINYDFE